VSHNKFSRPLALWTNASVPNARDLAHWDSNQFKSVDGDNGGTWNPTSPVGLGGSGVQLGAASVMNGGFTTQLGGRYDLASSDYPTFAANRTRTVRFSLRGLSASTGVIRRSNGTILGRPFTRQGWYNPGASVEWFTIPPRYIHNGATISEIRLYGFQTQYNGSALSSPSTVFQVLLYQADLGIQYGISTQWAPSHSYLINQYVIPLGAQAQTGLFYQAQSSFTSAGSPPSPWGTTIGGFTNEISGGGVWKAINYAGTIQQAYPYNAFAYYNGGAPWTIQLAPAVTPVANAAHSWTLGVTQDGGAWCYTAAEIDYINILNAAFE
jgi:hypothetical protein